MIVLNLGCKEGLTEKTFGQRREESEGVSHMVIPCRGEAFAKVLRKRTSRVLEK